MDPPIDEHELDRAFAGSPELVERFSAQARTLLTSREFAVDKIRDHENEIRGALRPHGRRVGRVSASAFEARVPELIADHPRLVLCMEALLRARETLRREMARLHAELLRVVKNDELCRRFMTIPGVGPVTALAFKTTIDRPDRFRRSADVGAHLGLTPPQYQSGELDRRGRISRHGDALTRTTLFSAAHVMLSHSMQWTALKAWGIRLAARRSLKKAKIAVAGKLAIIMHRMWKAGTLFRCVTHCNHIQDIRSLTLHAVLRSLQVGTLNVHQSFAPNFVQGRSMVHPMMRRNNKGEENG